MSTLDAKKRCLKSIISLIGSIVILIVIFFLGRCSVREMTDEEDIKRDTIYITHIDTVKITKDLIVYKTRLELDTLYIHDTILIREQREYVDSFAHIWISGFEPEIDSIFYSIPEKEVVVKTEITKTVYKESGLGVTIGPYLGAGVAVDGNHIFISPEVGVGVMIGWTKIIKRRRK